MLPKKNQHRSSRSYGRWWNNARRVWLLAYSRMGVMSWGGQIVFNMSVIQEIIHLSGSPIGAYQQAEGSQAHQLVQEMPQKDVIQPSSSPWASPVVLVQTKDGSYRFCVDYRKLNTITRKDAYPFPRVDDTLDALESTKGFSTLDLLWGY